MGWSQPNKNIFNLLLPLDPDASPPVILYFGHPHWNRPHNSVLKQGHTPCQGRRCYTWRKIWAGSLQKWLEAITVCLFDILTETIHPKRLAQSACSKPWMVRMIPWGCSRFPLVEMLTDTRAQQYYEKKRACARSITCKGLGPFVMNVERLLWLKAAMTSQIAGHMCKASRSIIP